MDHISNKNLKLSTAVKKFAEIQGRIAIDKIGTITPRRK